MENQKLEDIAFYIPKDNIVEVVIKDAVIGTRKIKPVNGYWVKKTSNITQPKYKPNKKILTFDEFKKKLPEIESPYTGEDGVNYKAVYDKLTDKVLYFKNGRRNSTKIPLLKAYETYLFDKNKEVNESK